jgi:hypothetical protein
MGMGHRRGADESELERGAATSVYLARSPEGGQVSGKYFANQRQAKPSAESQDLELADQLWQISEELSGLDGKTN